MRRSLKISLLVAILPCMAFAGDRHLVVDESLDWEAVFDGYLIVSPKLPEKVNNTAEVGGDDFFAAARVGDIRIGYSFNSSFNIDRPLMEKITISRLFIDRQRPGIYKEPIPPPEGYEWYSLDPKVNTPDPGSVVELESGTEGKVLSGSVDEPDPGEVTKEKTVQQTLPWWLVVFVALVLVALVVGVKSRR